MHTSDRSNPPDLKLVERATPLFRYDANEEIYAQGDALRRLYRLVEGVVRTTRLSSDGRRLVGDFYYAGDVFGFEIGAQHQFSAEALTACRVEAVTYGDAATLADVTHQELRRASAHVMLLGRKSAREKVALFLMDYASRGEAGAVDLPMGRQDIADYLGLTIETVSRMLTQLQGEAIIALPGIRRVEVKRWDLLQELAA